MGELREVKDGLKLSRKSAEADDPLAAAELSSASSLRSKRTSWKMGTASSSNNLVGEVTHHPPLLQRRSQYDMQKLKVKKKKKKKKLFFDEDAQEALTEMDIEEAEFEFSSSSGRIELNTSSHQSLTGWKEKRENQLFLTLCVLKEICRFSVCLESRMKTSSALTATK
jgi:hypothetical protein